MSAGHFLHQHLPKLSYLLTRSAADVLTENVIDVFECLFEHNFSVLFKASVAFVFLRTNLDKLFSFPNLKNFFEVAAPIPGMHLVIV